MFQSVTAGMDGTRESFAAVDWAAREAQLRHVPLQLVQVRETGAYPYTPIADDEVEEEWAQTVTNEVLDELNRRAPQLQTNVELVSGRPAHVLSGVSAKTDLLVLGSRGLGSLLGFIVGSTTLPTVAHTACPAVLVRAPQDEDASTDDSFGSFPASRPPEGDIVVGVDLSRPCDELIAFGFETAARHSAALRVLYAWDLPASYGIRPLPVPPAMTSELLAAQNQALAAALQPWQHSHPDVKVHAEAEIAQPARLLVEAASQASLLAVGRRNRRSRIGTHLGPVTHAVMHHARTPVAVVPHH
jgi:nucleotide-binding universal stress UspA family protein